MKIINLSILVAVGLSLTACSFTDSALKYSYEGTKRVEAGYKAKADMTKEIMKYLTAANKGCGVTVEVIDNKPVTTVRECIRPADVMASVDRMPIVKPQKLESIADGLGDFMVKATNIVVPTASIYYGYKNNQVNQQANVAIRQSDNQAQTSMWSNFTGSYQNNVTTTTTDTSVTDTSVDKSVTDTSVTDTQTTNTTQENTNETVPTISVDANSTSIN